MNGVSVEDGIPIPDNKKSDPLPARALPSKESFYPYDLLS